MRAFSRSILLMVLLAFVFAPAAWGLDTEHYNKAEQTVSRGIEYLRKTQNEDGSWSPQPGPAVTALVLTAMIEQPDIDANDPAVQKALKYVLSKVKVDGGIHEGILHNYNTAICLSALSHFNDQPEVADVLSRGTQYLRSLQWSDQSNPDGVAVDESHPFWGGFGYGNHGRPDGSNTYMAVQAFADMGVDCTDPAVQRALVFVERLQGTQGNKQFADKIAPDGGAIYATSVNKDQIGVPQSMAGEYVDEEGVSRLRTYGSMTYAMFKTYVYAQLTRDDPRVVDAVKWIENNYTLDGNPGMPEDRKMQGFYYYLVTFSRAMKAWTGSKTVITTHDGVTHDWANDLIARLAQLQREDGSFTNEADRWMEGDPNLVTAYAIIALTQAMR